LELADALDRIFDHVENGDVDKAVRACLRVSRHIKDYMHTALFLFELIDDRKEVQRVLMDDTSHLKLEAQKYIFTTTHERWLQSRTLPYSFGTSDSGGQKNILISSVGEFPGEIEQCERYIADLVLPPTMGEFDTAAFTDRNQGTKAGLRLRIRAINTIKSRVLNFCLNFAIQVERQVDAQSKTVSFLTEAQNEVQNYFKNRSDDVYQKLQKVNQLIDSTNSEDKSLLLTEVRRAIKSVADYFFPPRTGLITCSDGKERSLGDEQYLNRLQEYLATQFKSSSSKNLLMAELEYLLVFARKLNHIASKGVHADVSLAEAKQGFLGLYMFLYNVCQRLESKEA
jgi:hypothetical protein